jgi:TRAP-type C4-dicarboxylate transport system substrate-binding protein
MSATIHRSRTRTHRASLAALVSSLALATLSGCGSSSDATSSDSTAPSTDEATRSTVAITEVSEPVGSTEETDSSTVATAEVIEPVASTVPTTAATIPPGRYVKVVDDDVLAIAAEAGLDEGFRTWLRDAGPSSFDYVFSEDGHWDEGADECRCGVSKRGDFGSYTYDDDGRLVMTSENTDSYGFTLAFDWTFDDDVLTITGITFPDGTYVDTLDTLPGDLPPDFDPIVYLITTGSWKMEQIQSDTTVLDVGMTPGWDSIVDPVLAALDDASSGSLQGTFDLAWMDAHAAPDIEQQLIDAVAAGELDMAYVATRAFTDRGVTDFDALSAPFLVGDYDVQQAIFESDIPDRMLAGVDLAGVTALALAPGPFRYLQGVDRTFASPADIAGATFHTFTSPIYAATAEALGGRHTELWGPDRDRGLEDGTLDLTENGLGWMASNGRTNHVTVGAALWPATGVLIINDDVLDSMSDSQIAVLRQVAGGRLPAPADYADTDAEDLARLCAMGKDVHVATPAELDGLRAAVRPVYDQLQADETTAGYITEIQTFEGQSTPDRITPPDTCTE